VTVLLMGCDGTMLQSTTTDANGRYSFSGLPAGSYRLVFVAPAGSTYTVSPAGQGGDAAQDSDIDASGATACITVSEDESRSNIDAGFVPGVRLRPLCLYG
jgi:serine-aspartate repeat-containing protein C/D/E